jgi:hypothetical protein
MRTLRAAFTFVGLGPLGGRLRALKLHLLADRIGAGALKTPKGEEACRIALSRSPRALAAALALHDLTDPATGAHCMQQLVDAAAAALAGRWDCEVLLWRGKRVVDVADNYDRLGYPPDGPARDARYTRYVDERRVLRTQTSAAVPQCAAAARHRWAR